jgi:hypothetical protein
VNWRAIGCGGSAAAVFIGIGLLGMWLAFRTPEGCPATLQWAERSYRAEGEVATSPTLSGPGSPVEIGSTLSGLTTRRVYGPSGTPSTPSGADRPDQIAVECGGGLYQAYRWDGAGSP